MRARIAQALFGASIALLGGIAAADTVRITQINNPDLVELKRLPDGEYLWASDLEGLKPPVRAQRAPRNRLQFKHHGKTYEVDRGDVTLDREQALVVDACSTVPVSLKSDSRQASVKGAGEACRK